MISLKMDIVNNNINDYVYNHSYHSYNWYLLTNKTETNIEIEIEIEIVFIILKSTQNFSKRESRYRT